MQALQYVVGTPLTQEQKNQLRRSLDIDKDGRVTYGDFVQLVQNMFPFHLEDSQQQQLALALSEKLTMDIPQIPKIPPKVLHHVTQSVCIVVFIHGQLLAFT